MCEGLNSTESEDTKSDVNKKQSNNFTHEGASKKSAVYLIGALLLMTINLVVRLILVLRHYPRRKVSLPKVEDPVLLLSASDLAQKIRTRQLKSEDVLQAVISRIRSVQQLVNAIIDERFDQALDEARQVDDFLLHSELCPENLASLWPFLGVPFSTKGNISCKGLDHSVGLVARQGIKASEDAIVVRRMKDAGAILIAVTNVPELCCSWHTSNNIFGCTRNPHDLTRTAGGSSGGEAVLVSSACSFFGLGNDLTGSLRIPACFNGIYAHKATSGVVSNHGIYPVLEPVVNSVFAQGPLCRHASDLAPCLKVMAGENADSLQMEQKVELDKLRIYYYDDCPGDLLAGPLDKHIKEAFGKMIMRLRNELGLSPQRVRTLPHLHQGTWMLSSKLVAGTERPFVSILANDPNSTVNLPLEFIKWFLGYSKHELTTLLFGVIEGFTTTKKSLRYAEYRRMENELKDRLEDLLKEDAILLFPSCPFTAPYPAETVTRYALFSYFSFANMLGLPVTQCPLGVHPKDGLPIGLQVIAGRYSDRLTIGFACALERLYRSKIP